MGQFYLQRFEYRGAIDKSTFDKAWGVANETMAKTGNWGGVKKGVTHIHAYGTAFGGYGLIEVDDPAGLTRIRSITPTTTATSRISRSSRWLTWTLRWP